MIVIERIKLKSDQLKSYKIVRFEFLRDRIIGDSQVEFDSFHCLSLELTDGNGKTGLGFVHSLKGPLPPLDELEHTFGKFVWALIDGQVPASLLEAVTWPDHEVVKSDFYGFGEALQVALWDLSAQQAELPLAQYLGADRESIPAYASGLDFHLPDEQFVELFASAADAGFRAFKIKVGHDDPNWDIHRLDLLRKTLGTDVGVMIDANEAWSLTQAHQRLTLFKDAGYDLIWAEDPICRHDTTGLKQLSKECPWLQINSGEYLDVAGRTQLISQNGADIYNLHARVGETMFLGRLASQLGKPVALGNTTLETGVHTACALSNAQWFEYSFQNYDHLVDEPIRIVDGYAHVPERPGIGFSLAEEARKSWAQPKTLPKENMKTGPLCRSLNSGIFPKTKSN